MAQTNQESFSFTKRDLSLPVQRAGMFVGQSGGALIVGGGLDENGQPSADVFVQTDSGWKKSQLKEPVAFGGFVCGSFPEKVASFSKLFVAGGVTKGGLTSKVFSLEWRDGQLQQNELPPLPQAVALAGAGFFEDQKQLQLYVVGGTTSLTADSASHKLFRYSFGATTNTGWEELPPMPGEGRLLPGVICFYNDVHIFGGFTLSQTDGKTVYTPTTKAQAYRWHFIDGTTFSGWRDLSPLPEAVAAPVVFMTGQVHAGLAGGFTQPFTGNLFQIKPAAESKAIQIYHNVTDTWVEKGQLPEALASATAVHNGKLTVLGVTESGATAAYDMVIKRTVKSLRWPDYTGLIIYFVTVAFAGIYFTRKQTGSEGFALGDRKIPWWMAGISMFASAASSISFMAIPALAFRTSLLWALPALMLIPMFFLEAYVLYPLIRKLEITSTFEYLERRFHPSLRFIASAQAIALQTFGRMNMVLLLPALAIAAVTGMNVYASVLRHGRGDDDLFRERRHEGGGAHGGDARTHDGRRHQPDRHSRHHRIAAWMEEFCGSGHALSQIRSRHLVAGLHDADHLDFDFDAAVQQAGVRRRCADGAARVRHAAERRAQTGADFSVLQRVHFLRGEFRRHLGVRLFPPASRRT